MNASTWTLVVAAASVGALHTVAPDHWMPFALLSRARGWSQLRTIRTTVVCAFGHVTVSALLGIAALYVGLEVMHILGSTLEEQAIYVLMGFGVVYMVWGLLRSRKHHHHHPPGGRLTEWSMFLLFCSDPCVALIPMIMAAAGAGWIAVTAVIIAYEIATIGTMVTLVAIAHAGVSNIRGHWVEHYGHAAAGALIVGVAGVVAWLGV